MKITPLNDYMMEPQRWVVYRLNPNEQERNGEVSIDRKVDGRIFVCTLKIHDHTAILRDEKGEIQGVFSLHHFYLINV